MISRRKRRRLAAQKDRNRSRVYKPLKIKSNSFIIKDDTIQYSSGSNSILSLDVSRADVSNLPRSPDTAVRLVFREMQGIRGDIDRELYRPVIAAARRGVSRAELLRIIDTRLANLNDRISFRFSSILDKAVFQELREVQADIKADKPQAVLQSPQYLRALSTSRQALGRAREDSLSFVDDVSASSKYRSRLYEVHHLPSNGRCLSKGLSRILRTEVQAVRHAAARAALSDAGYQYVYWRLSSSHKNYGGSEICEVFAASTGRSVPSDAPFNRVGCYRIDEVPSPPHPNCMCSLEVVPNS